MKWKDMIIYSGSTTDIQHYQGLGISGSVVMTLLAPYLRKGHVLMWTTGTVVPHFSSTPCHLALELVGLWKGMPKFTVHPTGMAATGKLGHITGQPTMKPVCVLEYNKKMGAVDKADMMTGFLDCTRNSTKWYKKIFFHLLDTVLLNSHIVYWQITGEKWIQII